MIRCPAADPVPGAEAAENDDIAWPGRWVHETLQHPPVALGAGKFPGAIDAIR